MVNPNPKLKALLISGAFFFLITSITFLSVTKLFEEYFPARISGNSMLPVIHNNQWVITKSTFTLKRDHIYIVELPNQFKIDKYLIGLPHDTFYIKNNLIYINNKTYPTNFPDTPKTKISDNYYFFYGMNQTESLDSKYIGLIPKEQIKKEVLLLPF